MKNKITVICLLISTLSYAQYTGETPWYTCYGKNASCEDYGCSAIEVKTSKTSPVVAIVKKYGKVIKHAYISANQKYTFELPDGTYQVFFYSGEHWNKNKALNTNECHVVFGRFTSNESVQKDNPITLSGQIMTYTLTEVSYGNFSPKSSNLKEAL